MLTTSLFAVYRVERKTAEMSAMYSELSTRATENRDQTSFFRVQTRLNLITKTRARPTEIKISSESAPGTHIH